jgi:hypothetical protein
MDNPLCHGRRNLSLDNCFRYFLALVLSAFVISGPRAQMETARVSGQITDQAGRVVPKADVKIVNLATGVASESSSNDEGIYSFPGLIPSRYRVTVHKEGFREVVLDGLVLNVQDVVAQNVRLEIGSVAESVTVEATALRLNTTDGSVSTVVNRQFAENIPLNGRSFQSLIQLAPGAVLTGTIGAVDTGQFSVNGQRANANYWMVDGVSANIGINAGPNEGSGAAGTLGSTSVFGGTNSLVSVDALQEFRIQTSTYAPEFGRTPGGQISIVTRSGTNQFHGTAFDYLRNDVLDANDWFANSKGLPKPQERQNDFGGTFSGPVIKGNTFFFFSYEGFRLRLPQTALTLVPDTNPLDPFSRQFADSALLPYMNAYPLPNGPQAVDAQGNPIPGVAQFNASYSDPGTLDAYSLRVDHKLNNRLNLFGRYNYSPSKLSQRGGVGSSLSTISPTTTTTQTATVGATWAISPVAANDFRFNYSSTDASTSNRLDSFGGAVPLGALPFPSSFTARNGLFQFFVFSLGNNLTLSAGAVGHNQQRQINILDSVSLQKGSHSLKFGVDYRRLSPRVAPTAYQQLNFFFDVPSAETKSGLAGSEIASTPPATFLFRNLGIFAQDTWHIAPRLTVTYGLRWDVDFVPSSIRGPEFPAVTGFDLFNLSNLALAPIGTPPYKTKWDNLAPRIGLAYQVSGNQRRQMVLRGGFGVFYDLASSQAGSIAGLQGAYPFTGSKSVLGPPSGGTAAFPLNPDDARPPQIVAPDATNGGTLIGSNPNLKLPYTLQWNGAIEQAFGTQQTLSISYIGASGRRLIQTASITFPNPNLASAILVTNAGTSDYNALQLQFQRQLSRGLQALASYSWSHSLDTASSGSTGSGSNALSALNSNVNRGASDFDVRNAFSIALTYDVPGPKGNVFAKTILRGWSTENIIQARSAPPVNVFYDPFSFAGFINGFGTLVRPDVVPGHPFYLNGPQYPGGRSLNSTITLGGCPDVSDMVGPFCPPPTVKGLPTAQGNLGRNDLRGFGATQWDFAVHREFLIHESLKLQFRAELFNLLNHPNFGPPDGSLGSPTSPNLQFGQSTQMLGRSLAGGQLGNGAFDPLYQLGGPRSIQLGLKLVF